MTNKPCWKKSEERPPLTKALSLPTIRLNPHIDQNLYQLKEKKQLRALTLVRKSADLDQKLTKSFLRTKALSCGVFS